MVIKQTRTISYICPICGLTHCEVISLFNFSGKNEVVITCKCGKSSIHIKTKDYKNYSLFLPCIGCGENHEYMLSFYHLWVLPINIIRCRHNEFETCIIGNDDEVRKELDYIEKEKDLVADIIGFEKDFNNSSVMLEAVNKIHDIAEKDNIICECGCKNISVYMLNDKIILQCTKCSGVEVVNAKDNFDLKNILNKEQILLYKQIQSI